jgi:lipid-A-disaccharide synthase
LLGTPQVVCYRTATISWLIARLLIKVRYISLVNLVLGKECVKELIQFGFTEKNLKASLGNILTDPLYRQHMADGYSELEGKLGDQDASASAAAIVCRMASESR